MRETNIQAKGVQFQMKEQFMQNYPLNCPDKREFRKKGVRMTESLLALNRLRTNLYRKKDPNKGEFRI